MEAMKHFIFLKTTNGCYAMQDQGCTIYTGQSLMGKNSQTLVLRNYYNDPIITINSSVSGSLRLFHSHKDTVMNLQMEQMAGQLVWENLTLQWQLPASQYHFIAVKHSPYVDMIMSDEREVLGYSQGLSGWLKSTTVSAPFAAIWMLMQEKSNIRFVDETVFAQKRKEVANNGTSE